MQLGAEAFLVYLNAVLGSNFLGQIEREAKGIVQFEHIKTGQDFTFSLTCGLFHIVHQFIENGQTGVNRAGEALFLGADGLFDIIGMLYQLRVCAAVLLNHGIAQLGEERTFYAEHSAVTGSAAQQAAQYIAASLVRRQNTVGNHEDSGANMVADDADGNIVDGDKIMYICGKYMDSKGILKKDTVVTTVMSNLGMYKALEAHGMKSVKTKVGDRYVVEEMLKNGYNLGGEQSGHIIFLDYNTTGDGMLTALQLLSVIKETGKSLKELASDVTNYPQELVNIKVADKAAAMKNEKLRAIIEEVEGEMNGDGRVLVRPSGTEPLLRIMAEAATPELVHQYVERIADVARKELEVK